MSRPAGWVLHTICGSGLPVCARLALRLSRPARYARDSVNERLTTHPHVVVLGDLNDTPDSANLAPLLTETELKDISTSQHFDNGGFPGTFGTQGASNRLDYLLLSPALMDAVSASGFFREGVFSASDRWPFFETITAEHQQASDHAAVWAEIDIS